jgi:hypothetical protein
MPHPLDWEAQPEWAGLTLGIDHPDEVAELGRWHADTAGEAR